MSQKPDFETKDDTIREIHQIREQISDEFGGDIGAILAAGRRWQEDLGCRIIARGELVNQEHKPAE